MSEYIIDMGNSSYQSTSGLLCANVSQLREPIVRCRDCVHYADHEWITSPQYSLGTDIEHVCHFWHGEPTKVESDGFCAWGERR